MPDILRNKTSKDYSYTSRYSPFSYYYHPVDNKYVYELGAQLDNNTLYSLHVVSQGDTIDSLALKYYGNPTLFWIICDFNRIRDPYTKLTVGEKLKIPTISNIKFDMKGRTI